MDRSLFTTKVLAVVRTIPAGQTLSYGEVAKKAGFPGAARAVGTLMKRNFRPEIPCHRVVQANGFVGTYNRGGIEAKKTILQKEGVKIIHNKVAL